MDMEYDGLEELLDLGAYKKRHGFDLRRIIASLLI